MSNDDNNAELINVNETAMSVINKEKAAYMTTVKSSIIALVKIIILIMAIIIIAKGSFGSRSTKKIREYF